MRMLRFLDLRKYYLPVLAAAIIAGMLIFVGYTLWQRSGVLSDEQTISPPSEQETKVVYDPEYGISIYVDLLTVLASGHEIEELIRPFGGKVLFAVSETGTYLVQFPISTLEELAEIIQSLKRKGVPAYRVEAGVKPELGQ